MTQPKPPEPPEPPRGVSQDAQAILQRPIEEIKRSSRRKSKGTTTICSYVLPYDQIINQFYAIALKEPVRIPAGATISLHITLPNQRRRS